METSWETKSRTVVLLGAVTCLTSPGVLSAEDGWPAQTRHTRPSASAAFNEFDQEPAAGGSTWMAAPDAEAPFRYDGGGFSPGTLFQWSYGNSFSGGPDLDEPLVTDRPDFTEASVTVGRGVAQVEFGYTYTYNADDGVSERVNSWGEPLLRYGILADWLELRVALFPIDQRITAAGRSNTTAGTEDLHLGMKLALTPQEGWLPEMALIPQMNVPTGSNAFTNDEVLPGINWIYAWEVNDYISTGGSTQFNRVLDETTEEAYMEVAQSWTVAYTLTERLGAYTEWFALVPHSADTDRTQHFFNGGFTYLINNDVQWDIRAGTGLNGAADDYFLGTGLSVRFQ